MPRLFDATAQFPWGGSLGHEKTAKLNLAGFPLADCTLFNANAQKGDLLGPIKGFVLHWTAGSRRQFWDDYHAAVTADAKGNAIGVRTLKATQKGQHIWTRNTGMYGLTFCANGPANVTKSMIDMMGKIIAEVCHKHGLNPESMIAVPDKRAEGGGLVLTGGTNSMHLISDHAQYAVVDQYFPDRWDIGSVSSDGKPAPMDDPKNIWAQVRGKAIWYFKHQQFTGEGKPIYEYWLML
jgi:hypothetical protein